MDVAQLIAALPKISSDLNFEFFKTLPDPTNPSYGEMTSVNIMLSDGARTLQKAPPEKIDAVLAADNNLRMELDEELNRTFKDDPVGQFQRARFVAGLMNTLMNRAGLRSR